MRGSSWKWYSVSKMPSIGASWKRNFVSEMLSSPSPLLLSCPYGEHLETEFRSQDAVLCSFLCFSTLGNRIPFPRCPYGGHLETELCFHDAVLCSLLCCLLCSLLCSLHCFSASWKRKSVPKMPPRRASRHRLPFPRCGSLLSTLLPPLLCPLLSSLLLFSWKRNSVFKILSYARSSAPSSALSSALCTAALLLGTEFRF